MIDISIDLETTSLAPTAAVMSVALEAWKRYDLHSPFFEDGNGVLRFPTFSAHVDLRSMFLNGFTFSQDTADWWAQQNDEAKAALLANDSEDGPTCSPIDIVVKDAFDWIDNVKKTLGDEVVCLWAQGTDFDIAIWRNICYKLGIKFKIKHTQFRDHRTYNLEAAQLILDFKRETFDNDKDFIEAAQKLTQDYKDVVGADAAHDPVFDCKRSIYTTWQLMTELRKVFDNESYVP